MTSTNSHPQWVRGLEAIKLLGVSRDTLLRLRKDGRFQPGIHYRRLSKTHVQYNVETCQRALSQLHAALPHQSFERAAEALIDAVQQEVEG